jgi:hypothetical protein
MDVGGGAAEEADGPVVTVLLGMGFIGEPVVGAVGVAAPDGWGDAVVAEAPVGRGGDAAVDGPLGQRGEDLAGVPAQDLVRWTTSRIAFGGMVWREPVHSP